MKVVYVFAAALAIAAAVVAWRSRHSAEVWHVADAPRSNSGP